MRTTEGLGVSSPTDNGEMQSSKRSVSACLWLHNHRGKASLNCFYLSSLYIFLVRFIDNVRCFEVSEKPNSCS